MPTYNNGSVPYSVVSEVLATGTDSNGKWEFRCTPAFKVRWEAAKAYAVAHFGRSIFIRTGWNIYRPLFSQHIARNNACASGNCAGAAVPGSSSHGGNWRGRDCLAVDVDPNGLTWGQVDEAMESAGFSAGLITSGISGMAGGEPWHYILFEEKAFGPVPAGLDVTDFTIDEAAKEDEDDMKAIKQSGVDGSGVIIQPGIPPYSLDKQVFDALVGAYGLTVRELADWQYETAIREQWTAYSTAQKFAAKGSVNVDPAAVDAIVKGVRDSLGFTVTVEPS